MRASGCSVSKRTIQKRGQYGQATFSSLQSFLQGTITTFTAVPNPAPLSWRSLEGAFYTQDEMRLSPRLTLSLGFRAESTNGWNEASGRASNFYLQPKQHFANATKNQLFGIYK
jgi:hypothetical protein